MSSLREFFFRYLLYTYTSTHLKIYQFIPEGKIDYCIFLFSFFRDYLFRRGNILMRRPVGGRRYLFPFHLWLQALFLHQLYHIFLYEPLTPWRTSDLELSMTSLPKPKTSLAGRSCPKYSISSTKELVSRSSRVLLQGDSKWMDPLSYWISVWKGAIHFESPCTASAKAFVSRTLMSSSFAH